MIISTITEAIGSTPLYRFDNQHYSMPNGSAIYAKLEYLNPGGSIKDRLGSYLIKEGFAQGKINEKRRSSNQLPEIQELGSLWPHSHTN